MTLDQFLAELDETARDFKQWWEKEHTACPERFPLSFPEGNAGMWLEQFLFYFTNMPRTDEDA